MLPVMPMVVAALVMHRSNVLDEAGRRPVRERRRGRAVHRGTGCEQSEAESGCDKKITHRVLLLVSEKAWWRSGEGTIRAGLPPSQGRM
jgi:hypothetical protein